MKQQTTAAPPVNGFWQGLVDRRLLPLQRLLMHRQDPVWAPGRSAFSDLSHFSDAAALPVRRYLPHEVVTRCRRGGWKCRRRRRRRKRWARRDGDFKTPITSSNLSTR